MLEIVLLWLMTKHVGRLVEEKGHSSGGYKVLTVALWFSGEFVGALLGMALTSRSESAQCSLYVFALLGAATGAGLAHLIASNLAPASSLSKRPVPVNADAQPALQVMPCPQASGSQGSPSSSLVIPSQSGKVSVYKRYSNGPGNVEIVEGQGTDDDTAVAVRLPDGGSVGPEYGFQCPWCRKPYTAQDVGRSLILNCVKCGQQMMVATDG